MTIDDTSSQFNQAFLPKVMLDLVPSDFEREIYSTRYMTLVNETFDSNMVPKTVNDFLTNIDKAF